jgi:son of sevenless-like protein
MSRSDIQPVSATTFVRALYTWDGENDRTCLAFQEGDIIQIIQRAQTGWWDGVIDGRRGWLPSNYVELYTDPRSSKL